MTSVDIGILIFQCRVSGLILGDTLGVDGDGLLR